MGAVQTKNLFDSNVELEVGDEITVIYDGSMQMKSPGRFGEVYEMFYIDEEGKMISAFPEENE